MPKIDRSTKLTANEPSGILQRIHRLSRDMPVADNRDEHFGVVHVLRDLNARHGRKTEPHIAHILRDNLGERPLQRAIDPTLPFTFQNFFPINGNLPNRGRQISAVPGNNQPNAAPNAVTQSSA